MILSNISEDEKFIEKYRESFIREFMEFPHHIALKGFAGIKFLNAGYFKLKVFSDFKGL